MSNENVLRHTKRLGQKLARALDETAHNAGSDYAGGLLTSVEHDRIIDLVNALRDAHREWAKLKYGEKLSNW